MYTLKNNTNKDLPVLTKMIKTFFPFAQKKVGFNKPVSVSLQSDQQNAQNPFGKTAYYEPASFTIVLYIDGRHPKDVMRSLSHELVHHGQNCNGQFNGAGATEEGYAQKNPHLRNMEKEAFLKGNMIFRDWCDLMQTNGLEETNYKSIKGDSLMTEDTIRELIQKALQTALGSKNLVEDTETPIESTEDVFEEEEGLKEGGAADRPENKDKHVADSGRGKRVHLEEEEEITEEEEEELEERRKTTDRAQGRDAGGRRVKDTNTGEKINEDEEEPKDEEKPLKEWWENSLYTKLIKDYTKR